MPFVRLGSEEFEDTFSYSGMYLFLIDGEEGTSVNLAANGIIYGHMYVRTFPSL